MNYELKDKINVTKELLSELETKSWQEIEHLQIQIANIETNQENTQVIQLLKNLLTSYYIFVGGLETISDGNSLNFEAAKQVNSSPEPELHDDINISISNDELSTEDAIKDIVISDEANQDFEPFEYFVEFDEPAGEPISDEDLYNN